MLSNTNISQLEERTKEYSWSLLSDELSPLFWQPSLLESPSAWFGHIPFAHWLIRQTEPRVLVELGTHAGVSYSAFCATVARDGLGTRCFAVDTWRGDDQAGHYPEQIYTELSRFNQTYYGGFSTLLRQTFDEALDHFADGTVDILHIDGFHSYDAVSHDFNTWKPKLSDRAVVLFHDTNEHKEGFGVWRFWAEMKEQFPNFEFLHSHGLGVLCVGESSPPSIVELCGLGEAQANRLRERFQFLGERWSLDARLQRQLSDAAALKQKIKELNVDNAKQLSEARRTGVVLEAKTRQFEKRLKDATNHIEDAERRAALGAEKTSQLEQEKRALLSSTSWRITAPVRTIASWVPEGVRNRLRTLTRIARRNVQWKCQYRALNRSPLFDKNWYLDQYSDVRASNLDPLRHYLLVGANEGRNPSEKFDSTYYLSQYPDVKDAGLNPLFHYIRAGQREGRTPLPPQDESTAIMASIQTQDAPAIFCLDNTVENTRMYQEWDFLREEVFLTFVDEVYKASQARYDDTLVSIIMPTFNRAGMITKAIESVRNQSHQHWELIIIDDGSTDNTRETLKPFLRDNRIRYVYQDNAGVSSARNRGLSVVQGNYVFYLDSDNGWKANHLLSLLVFMDRCDLAAAYSGLECIGDDEKIIFYRGARFHWESCYHLNYIDINCFAHRGDLAKVFSFDTKLKRLVDWEYILNVTKLHRTAYAPFRGVTYYGGDVGDRITLTEYNNGELPKMMKIIRDRHVLSSTQVETIRQVHPNEDDLANLQFASINPTQATSEALSLRIGYVVWDWPALSQTFVVNEIRWLIQNGFDVRVYYKVEPDRACKLDFPVESFKVKDAEELTKLVLEHGRTALHSPFAFPATTILTWPAATAAKVPFTFMPGGVDISHYENRKRNQVAAVASSEHCAGVITLGTYHKDFLLKQGVPSNRIVMERQAVRLPDFHERPARPDSNFRIVAIGRFVEKKGFKYLIQAAPKLKDTQIIIYGYGPEEQALRKLIAEVGAENVLLAGELGDSEALHDAYYGADLFALPCVEAENGDLDGLPTVLLEAMAAGTPVLTTKLANIPDLVKDGITGFLAAPNDPASIIEAVHRIRSFPRERLDQLITDANDRARSYASIDQTMSTLLQCWVRRSIDIFLVTYDTDKYANLEDTIDIIDRIYQFTSMPFNLIVIDNDSQREFRHAIKAKYGERNNFSFLELPENLMCGPASNIALGEASADYAIYICSKEGFILQHGWEVEIVRAMDANPNAAIGGHVVSLPQHRTCKEIQEYPTFPKWRNKEFAQLNPDRAISHVQGGFYILRRQAYMDVGGFNEAVPHDGMDVEYSYYLISKGYQLLPLPNIAAISNKTRPELYSLVDEGTFFVHPSGHREISKYDRIVRSQTRHCVCCGWQGNSFIASEANDQEFCPSCTADGFARSVWRSLSHSGRLQTRPTAYLISANHGLEKSLRTLCKKVTRTSPAKHTALAIQLNELTDLEVVPELVIIDHFNWDREVGHKIVKLASNGTIVVAGAPINGDLSELATLAVAQGIDLQPTRFLSASGAFDWRKIVTLQRVQAH